MCLAYGSAFIGGVLMQWSAWTAMIQRCRATCSSGPSASATRAQLTMGRCLGSHGELGFCVAAGDGIFVDSGGSGCGGTTPDCDVVSGTISQCPASSFSGTNPASPVSSAPPAESDNLIALPGGTTAPTGLDWAESSRRKRKVRAEGAKA